LNWGVALNLTLALVLIMGAIGWFAYFARVLGSAEPALWLSAVMALTRFRWTMALTYEGGDQLIWAASPWVLLAAAAAIRFAHQGSRRGAAALSGFAGAAGASLFALKYSGIFIGIGCAAVFGTICLVHRYWQNVLCAGIGFVAVIGVILWAGFLEGPTPADSTHTAPNLLPALASLGLTLIGVTDLDPLMRAFLYETTIGGELTAPFIGVFLSVVILVSLVAFLRFSPNRLIKGDRVLVSLAIGAVIADLLILFLLILNGGNISPAGRFGRVSGFLLLPILVAAWQGMLRDDRSVWRATAIVSATAIVILPTTLATVRQVPNLIDRLHNAGSNTDVDGIVNQHLTIGTNLRAFYAEVSSIAPKAVLYTIYPQMAFPVAQRRLILVGGAEEHETPATLSRKLYRGRPPGGVALLLPIWFEHNGKLQAIQSSFVDIPKFVRHELRTDRKWVLWTSTKETRPSQMGDQPPKSD
jgi:hypothetical protein